MTEAKKINVDIEKIKERIKRINNEKQRILKELESKVQASNGGGRNK